MNIKRLACLSNICITKAPLGFAWWWFVAKVALGSSGKLVEAFLGGGGTFICSGQKEGLLEALRGP